MRRTASIWILGVLALPVAIMAAGCFVAVIEVWKLGAPADQPFPFTATWESLLPAIALSFALIGVWWGSWLWLLRSYEPRIARVISDTSRMPAPLAVLAMLFVAFLILSTAWIARSFTWM